MVITLAHNKFLFSLFYSLDFKVGSGCSMMPMEKVKGLHALPFLMVTLC